MERQIGEKFDFLDVKIEVIEGEKNSCEGCYLCDTKICGYEIIINYLSYGAHSEREDKKEEKIKKVE